MSTDYLPEGAEAAPAGPQPPAQGETGRDPDAGVNVHLVDDLGQNPLTTKEGFTAFSSQTTLEPPHLLPPSVRSRLTPDEDEIYKDVRQRFHSQLLLVRTPDITRFTTAGLKLVRNNRGKQLGRKGLAAVGWGGTGKSTCLTHLGKKHHIERARHGDLQGRIPVVYIICPPEANPLKLSLELATFLGLPVHRWDGEPYITRAVVSVLRKVGCGLVLVDEIQRVDLNTKDGQKAADHLKYLFDSVPATFVFAGTLDLTLFDGPRGLQFASRFKTITTTTFGYGLKKQRELWDKLIVSMEEPLLLHKHRPGMLLEHAHYLHRRSGGIIGNLDQLIHEAANDAIADGKEQITKKHLDDVLLTKAAEQQYTPIPPPRKQPTSPTAGQRKKITGTPGKRA